jgi:hypothetical protein
MSDPATERQALQRLLDAVDAAAPDLVQRAAARPLTGRFFGWLADAGLDDREVALVLVALAGRLSGHATLSGQDLVARAASDSASRLQALSLLLPERRLVARGLLVPEVAGGGALEAHTATWRLGDVVFRRACELFAGPGPAVRDDEPHAYARNEDLLMDLRRLSIVYRQRAARLFHLDPWSGTGLEASDGPVELVARARDDAARLLARLAVTGDRSALPLLTLADEHALDLDALVILVTVLFQELVEGVGAVDAVDLIKLVSESEADLLRLRGILRPLVRKRLLQLEGGWAGKDLTADAALPHGMIERMLGEPASIDSDARIDFHAYLQRLDSSDPFFLDLDSGGSAAD